MNKYLFIIIFFLLGSCQSFLVKKTQNDLLDSAYEQKSLELFDQFLENWETNQKDILEKQNTVSNDTIKTIYKIYELLYDPIEWNKDRSDSNLARPYKGIRNVIIPTNIEFEIVDTLLTFNQITDIDFQRTDGPKPKILYEKSISNFFPKYQRSGVRTLYLIPLYRDLLNDFLENGFFEFKKQKYNKDKLKFLGEITSIHHGHWGGYFLTSHPRFSRMRFNKSLTKVIVPYRYMYGGGEIILELINKKWTKIGYGGGWVE